MSNILFKSDIADTLDYNRADMALSARQGRALKQMLSSIKKEMMLEAHPVGSLYWSMEATDPSKLFGGTWEQIKDKFILSCGDTYANGSTGGSTTHNHKYGAMVLDYYYTTISRGDNVTGLLDYQEDGSYSVTSHTFIDQTTRNLNGGDTASTKAAISDRRLMQANTTTESNLPPFIVAYCWKRTA